MKRYAVEYRQSALRTLKKMDRSASGLIYTWIEKNLVGCANPRVHGRSLMANRRGQWRYRVGGYRLIAEIHDDIVTILMVAIGHRGDVYH